MEKWYPDKVDKTGNEALKKQYHEKFTGIEKAEVIVLPFQLRQIQTLL
jgi:hypothetical protein